MYIVYNTILTMNDLQYSYTCVYIKKSVINRIVKFARKLGDSDNSGPKLLAFIVQCHHHCGARGMEQDCHSETKGQCGEVRMNACAYVDMAERNKVASKNAKRKDRGGETRHYKARITTYSNHCLSS